jgi:ABC-2 type transport system permease protein
MRHFLILWRRELATWFVSPAAYVIMMFFLGFTGLSFWLLVALCAPCPVGTDMVREFFGSISFWIAMLAILPVVTMRLLAEEKRTGTIETLMTAPVTGSQVVLAKYAAAVVFFAALWLPTIGYFLALHVFNPRSAVIDAGALGAAYFGVFCVGAFYIAVGLLASALARNQVVSAVACFSVICGFFLVGFLSSAFGNVALRRIAFYMASFEHMLDFSRGVVDTRPIVFYLSGTVVFLVAAVRSLDADRAG